MLNELLQIQQTLNAPKGLTNKFGGYKYRSAETILEAVKPLLKEQGIVITIDDSLEQVGDRYYIKATVSLHKDNHTIKTQAYAREEESKKGMDGSQITGASSSYARKYALNGMFAIDDTKDSDATNDGKPVQKTEAKEVTKDPLTAKKEELNGLFQEYGYKTLPKMQAEIHEVLKKLTIGSADDAQKVIDSIRKKEMIKGANGNNS